MQEHCLGREVQSIPAILFPAPNAFALLLPLEGVLKVTTIGSNPPPRQIAHQQRGPHRQRISQQTQHQFCLRSRHRSFIPAFTFGQPTIIAPLRARAKSGDYGCQPRRIPGANASGSSRGIWGIHPIAELALLCEKGVVQNRDSARGRVAGLCCRAAPNPVAALFFFRRAAWS